MNNEYTEEENAEILRRYPWDDTEKIAKDLGRSKHAIRGKARRMKLVKLLYHVGKRLQNENV